MEPGSRRRSSRRSARGPARSIPCTPTASPWTWTRSNEIASANRLLVIEDAAEAHGAKCRGRPVGSLGDAAAFSFYGNKILTTGEGGMVTTDDPAIAAAARELRAHGFSTERHFWHRLRAHSLADDQPPGGSGPGADRAPRGARRRTAANRGAPTSSELADVPGLAMPPEVPGLERVHWMFGMLVEPEFGLTRDELRGRLAQRGIETRTFFIPLHIQPAYLADNRGRRLPVAERLGTTGLYLPSGPDLSAGRDRERGEGGAGGAGQDPAPLRRLVTASPEHAPRPGRRPTSPRGARAGVRAARRSPGWPARARAGPGSACSPVPPPRAAALG